MIPQRAYTKEKEIIEKLEGELNYLESIIKEKIGNMIATNNAHNLLKELEEALSLADTQKGTRKKPHYTYIDIKNRDDIIGELEKQISDLETEIKRLSLIIDSGGRGLT